MTIDDFKPMSVDYSKQARMRVSEDEVIVSVPNVQVHQTIDTTASMIKLIQYTVAYSRGPHVTPNIVAFCHERPHACTLMHTTNLHKKYIV